MSQVESSFASFANYTSSLWKLTFSVPSAGIAVGQTIGIPHTILGETFTDSVTVSQANATSFTFSTNAGHPLNANITFTASQFNSGLVGFSIYIQGQTSSPFWSLFFSSGGSEFEDDVWNHFLDQVRAQCAKH